MRDLKSEARNSTVKVPSTPAITCNRTPWAAKYHAYGILQCFLRALAGRTGACAQGGDLPTGPYQTRVHSEGQRQTPAAGPLDLARSGLHDSGDAGAGADL